MKIIYYLILLWGSQANLYSGGIESYSFKASFPEGFGVYLKSKVTLKMLDPAAGAKAEGTKKIYIVLDDNENVSDKKDKLLPILCSDDDELKLKKIFAGKSTISAVIGGYESIESEGIPGVSKSAKNDEDLVIPAGITWSAYQCFIMEKFDVITNVESQPE